MPQHEIRCFFAAPGCAGALGLWIPPPHRPDAPYPGDARIGLLCPNCAPLYQAQLAAEAEAAIAEGID